MLTKPWATVLKARRRSRWDSGKVFGPLIPDSGDALNLLTPLIERASARGGIVWVGLLFVNFQTSTNRQRLFIETTLDVG